MFDGTVRHQQTMFHIEIRLFLNRVFESLPKAVSVVGMNSLKCHFYLWLSRSIVSKEVVSPLRPVDFSTRNIPSETARFADPLALHQASFTAPQLGIESGILQRNCGLRSQQFQHGNAVRSEGAGSQVVFEKKHAGKLRLVDDWQAQEGLGVIPPHIFVLCIHVIGGGIIQERSLQGPDHVMQRGLGEIGRRNGRLSNGNLDAARASGCLGFDSWLATPKQDEQTSLSPGILHRYSYQLLDELGKDHLTRKCLRGFDYSLDIQLRDRLSSRGRRGGSSFLAQARVTFVKLLHLAVGAPTVVAIPGFLQVRVRYLVEASCGVESRGKLIGDRFVLYEAILARQANGRFEEALCIELSAVQARDFGFHYGVLVTESRRIIFSPLA